MFLKLNFKRTYVFFQLECCGGYDKNDYHQDDVPQSCSSDRTNNIYIHVRENLKSFYVKIIYLFHYFTIK